jgi:hypothetical protein
MINEKAIQFLLESWLKEKFFKSSKTLVRSEVNFKIDDFNFIADIIAIQSRSNIIHGFEIKGHLKKENVLSAIWQTNSYYTNYKWLVIQSNDKMLFDGIDFNKQSLGIGVILFDREKQDFSVFRQAKYSDGNFLKFLPELEEQWLTINKSEKE